MRLSAKTEYACLAMLQLAEEFASGEPVQIRRIAEIQGIPSRFLVQILLQLKSVGLVSSTRGAAGGYRLNHPPEEISLAEVIDVMEGEERPPRAAKSSPLSRALMNACSEAGQAQRDRLEAISLVDLLQQTAGREPMWYI